MKLIEVSGGMEIPDEMTIDEFTDIFLELIESKGWYFGGGFSEIIDETDKYEQIPEKNH